MEFSQELISVAVLVLICSLLSVVCTCIWFCRCRQDSIQASENKHDRAVQLQNYELEQSKNGRPQASLSAGKRLDINDIERSTTHIPSHREEPTNFNQCRETIGQYEERVTSGGGGPRPVGVAHRFRDEENARNKRLDTISEIAMSNDSLQRNDSKTNVFNNNDSRKSPCDVDLNPGLSSSINLEKI